MKPSWTVLEADASGRPRTRVWRLPRLLHPGVAIWHERGVYEVMHQIGRTDTYLPSGIRGRTLRRVLATLRGTT